jgi:hypothetical protein
VAIVEGLLVPVVTKGADETSASGLDTTHNLGNDLILLSTNHPRNPPKLCRSLLFPVDVERSWGTAL